MFTPFFCHWYMSVGVPVAVTENVAVSPTVTVWFEGCIVIAGGVPDAGVDSRTRTQSPLPALLLPDGVKFFDPVLAKGDPAMAEYVPLEGSYQREVTEPLSFVMSIVKVRSTGV